MTLAAAFAAWLGGSIILLSDGRRGLATGLAILTAGLATLAFAAGYEAGAVAVLAGGGLAALLQLRTGREGWGLVPAGSTPHLILSIVAGLISLWVAAGVATGPWASVRFAVVTALVLLVVRLMQGAEPSASATSASGIALALGAGTVLAPGAVPDAACLVAAVVAAGLQAIPRAEAHGA